MVKWVKQALTTMLITFGLICGATLIALVLVYASEWNIWVTGFLVLCVLAALVYAVVITDDSNETKENTNPKA